METAHINSYRYKSHYYYSVAARKVGAQKAFAQYPDIKVVGVGTFTSPEKAYEVATSMLTANPNLKGLFRNGRFSSPKISRRRWWGEL